MFIKQPPCDIKQFFGETQQRPRQSDARPVALYL